MNVPTLPSGGLRVLVIASMYPSQKSPYYGNFVKEQVDILQDQGIQCVVIANQDNRRGSWNALRKYSGLGLRVLVALFRQDFDLIHAHTTFFAGLFGLGAAFLSRKPFIVHVHGTDDLGEFLQKNALQSHKKISIWLAKLCLHRADHIIAVSHYLRNLLIDQLNISGEKISVVDMGVNTDWFRPADKRNARIQLGLTENGKKIVCVGSLHPAKGVNYLIEAMALINCPDWSLLIVGGGQERENLQMMADRLEIPVIFSGEVPKSEVPLWMAAADVLAHPTLSEGFGLVVLEALSCGIPVIASKIGGIPEIVEDGLDGYLVEPGNIHELAFKIQRGLKEAESLGATGRQKALNHDCRLQASRVIDVYRILTSKVN